MRKGIKLTQIFWEIIQCKSGSTTNNDAIEFLHYRTCFLSRARVSSVEHVSLRYRPCLLGIDVCGTPEFDLSYVPEDNLAPKLFGTEIQIVSTRCAQFWRQMGMCRLWIIKRFRCQKIKNSYIEIFMLVRAHSARTIFQLWNNINLILSNILHVYNCHVYGIYHFMFFDNIRNFIE